MDNSDHEICASRLCDYTPTFMVGVYKPEEHDADGEHWHTCNIHLVDVVQMLVDGGHLVLVEGTKDE